MYEEQTDTVQFVNKVRVVLTARPALALAVCGAAERVRRCASSPERPFSNTERASTGQAARSSRYTQKVPEPEYEVADDKTEPASCYT